MSLLVRQLHRWVALFFMIVVLAIFGALGMGRKPAEWVYFIPLAPLALLMLSGIYLFFLPYLSRRSS